MHPGPGQLHMMRGFTTDPSVTKQQLKPGTIRRIAGYARPYRRDLTVFLLAAAVDAVITVAIPVLLGVVIDRGVLPGRVGFVLAVAGAVAGLAILDGFLNIVQRWFTARVGEGLIYDLRTQVFAHVQRQPIAFFTRAQTGSLVSRLNSDVIGAQQALTSTLVSTVSSSLQLILVLVTMLYFSWLVTLIALALIPMFIIPARLVGRRLQRLTRESMQLDAAMGSTMTERFNVAGAMLAKLFGRPEEESDTFAGRAAKVRDIGIVQAMYGSSLFIALTLLASLSVAVVYGVGGTLVVHGAFQVGTLVSLALLLNRLYGPITALSNVQVNLMTALVSFDRVFEVLDLKPLIEDRPGAVPLVLAQQGNGSAPTAESAAEIVFDSVSFRYPAASEVSLASLESIALPSPERTDARQGVLHDMSFAAPARQLTALVGPSGAGKTTITALVARLYDPNEGTVRIGGSDIRDVTQESLHDAVGVVTQDAHLFHDTIRANLSYARPGATEEELIEACRSAQIWDLISVLPDGLDTIVGDRGYRLSGGEKQRVALARLLLKAPAVVVLDEATAHLDSESEAAVQQALRTALQGRTSLVIAHRLSTIREADQILVIDEGRIVERGHHEELLEAGGMYADLYWTQFARQETAGAGVRLGVPGEDHFPDHVPPHLLEGFPPPPPHRQRRPDQPRPPDRPHQLPGFNDLGPPGRPRHGGPDSGNGPAPFGGL
jgi:ATP-binding cassette subfamily B protein